MDETELTEEQIREFRHQRRMEKKPVLQYSRDKMTLHLKIEDFDYEEMKDLILGLWGSLDFGHKKDFITELQWYLVREQDLPAISLSIVRGMAGREGKAS